MGVPNSVHLRGGAEVVGDLLDRNDDRVVIDLGYTVLSIPVEEILELAPLAADYTPIEEHELALFRSGGTARPASVSENVTRLGASVVQVSTPTGRGSGFVIHPDGYVVTNAHVVRGEYSITVTVYEQKKLHWKRGLSTMSEFWHTSRPSIWPCSRLNQLVTSMATAASTLRCLT